MNAICSHTDSIKLTELPAVIAGCEECLPIGARGCIWSWCYLDNVAFVVTSP